MFTDVDITALALNPFETIGTEWMLITAQREGRVNTMTASWGGLGVLFGKNVATIYIRPQRYTKEFVDAAASFSLTVFPERYRDALAYLGEVSGRDEDKIQKSALTLAREQGIPYFAEARLVLLCKKIYAQPMRPECFVDSALDRQIYPDADHHTLYVGEIVRAMARQE